MKMHNCFLVLLCLAVLICAVACTSDKGTESTPSAEQSATETSAAEPSEEISAAESQAHATDSSATFVSHVIRTGSNIDGVTYPNVTMISSAPELTTYYMENKTKHSLNDTFKGAISNYDSDFFQSKVLLMVVVNANSGSVEYTTKGVELTADGRLKVNLECYQPAVMTFDLAVWHTLIELDKDYAVTADKVDVVIDRTE